MLSSFLEVGAFHFYPETLKDMYNSWPDDYKGYLSALILRNPCWKLFTDAKPIEDSKMKKVSMDFDNFSFLFSMKQNLFDLVDEASLMFNMTSFLLDKGLINQSVTAPVTFNLSIKGTVTTSTTTTTIR